MLNHNMKKYRAAFLVTTSLVAFFLLYITVNTILTAQATKAIQFTASVESIVGEISKNTTESESRSIKMLAELRDGNKQFKPLAAEIAPQTFSVQEMLNEMASDNSEQVTSLGKKLTSIATERAERKLRVTRILQYVAAALIALVYIVVVIPIFNRLSITDETEDTSQKETQGIMNTLSEGLFLLTANHEIGIEQSASLKRMFKLERDLEGNFFDFISQYVTQEQVQIAKDYVNLLFGDRVKEKLVEDLNPLNNVEISIVRRDGSYENHYLDFKFKRVLIDGEISHLMGSVSDVTKQVRLEKQLVEAKGEQEAQLELMMSILHVDATQLQKFFNSAESSLDAINETLESKGYSDTEIRLKLKEINRKAHQLKGDAAALALHKFEFTAHDLETEIENVQAQSKKISGRQLIPTTSKLRDLYSELDRMRTLVDKFSKQLNQDNKNLSLDESGATESIEKTVLDTKKLTNLTDELGRRNGTDVALRVTNMPSSQIPEDLAKTLDSVAVQLLRNSVVHGGEEAATRITKGKSEQLNIGLRLLSSTEKFQLVIQDDGKGISAEKVISRAIELGLLSGEQAETFDKRKTASLLFKPGFSTLNEASLDGGRGIGLDATLALIREHKGTVSVQSGQDRFCRFTINFPPLSPLST